MTAMTDEQTPAAGPLTAESPVPAQHPMMVAWTAYSEGDEYANSARWAAQPEHTKGSMWAAFCSGWSAGTRHVASPASLSSVVQGDASGVGRDQEPTELEMQRAEVVTTLLRYSFEGGSACEVADEIIDLIRAQPSGETRETHCQRCGGEIQGWFCQSCPAEFRENDDGYLVFNDEHAPVASSDQPEQGGGMEVAGEVGEMPGSNGGFTMAVFKATDVPLGTKLTPAEPAEARVRELELQRDEAVREALNATPFSRDEVRRMCDQRDELIAAAEARATAAKAQLAKAKEALEKTRKDYVTRSKFADHDIAAYYRDFVRIIDQTLAALQEGGAS